MSGYRKLSRPTDHRRAMLRGMVTYLLKNGSIETTLMRAKEVRRIVKLEMSPYDLSKGRIIWRAK